MKSESVQEAPSTFQTNVPLSRYSTFGIGGAAKLFCDIQTAEQMQQAILYCNQEKISYLVLGKGSNVLFDDRGFDGAILYNRIGGIEWQGEGIVQVGSGYSFALLGNQTARQGFSGLEFASGIPGSVGGAVFMNAGANGQETADTLVSVDYINRQGERYLLDRKGIEFGYRYSSFHEWAGAIVGATFALKSSSDARQRQLDLITYRTSTQPYQDKSAGCVFRNPPSLSAGALIDRSGLKGFSIGGAAVSEKHANFIINRGQATALETLTLISHIQQTIFDQHGIWLECEVRCIPYQLEST